MSLVAAVGLTLVLLANPAQSGTPSFADCEAAPPRVDLLPETTSAPSKACISASLVTVFSFDTEISRDSVSIQGRDRFEKVEASDSAIILKPKHNLTPGERYLLSVSFLDGAAPESVTFLLVAHPALATRQIDVFRRARPIEACQQEVQEARTENAQLRSRVKQFESQALTKGGLTDLIVNGIVREEGVKTMRLEDLHGMHGNALAVRECLSFHAFDSRRVALSLSLAQPQPQEWSIKEIFLADDHGGVFRPFTWLGEGPIPPSNAPYEVTLEWQLKGSEVARSFTLVVVGNDGRTVRVGRIVFPQ
jgi:uncharacterized protein (TIGR02268 family)